MRTDYIDIAQFHDSLARSAREAEGALDELLRLKQERKLRFIGVSGILPNLAEQVESGVFDTFQIPYSALQREHEGMIARVSAAGAGIIIRGGVARGAPTDWNKRYYMLTRDELSDRWDTAGLDELLNASAASSSWCALRSPSLHLTPQSSVPRISTTSAITSPQRRRVRFRRTW
jgi:aryl-alcohol dehydrogenase-like predicted oxidoreductase